MDLILLCPARSAESWSRASTAWRVTWSLSTKKGEQNFPATNVAKFLNQKAASNIIPKSTLENISSGNMINILLVSSPFLFNLTPQCNDNVLQYVSPRLKNQTRWAGIMLIEGQFWLVGCSVYCLHRNLVMFTREGSLIRLWTIAAITYSKQ